MIAPRWRKVARDIAETPLRTALAVAAMAAGAFGVSMILTSYSILNRELKTTYSDTRPAAAILTIDGAVGDALVAVARRVPGVADAEARPVIYARLRIGNAQWVPLILFVVRDFRDLRMDRFIHDSGAWSPGNDEVLIERASMSVTHANVGDRVIVRTNDRVERTIRIAGTVHAAGLAPGWMEHAATGFITWTSSLRSSASSADQLRILVTGDEHHIREVANRVTAATGHVTRIDVPTPGRHPHAAQMDTFLFLLGAFGALTFALSAVLVANMIHALLVEQLRQVGVMKTLGASTRQIAALYLGQVSMLAVAALILGIPAGIAAGRTYAAFCASMLNATITDAMPPAWIIAIEVAAGIAIPLLVALGPVFRASRITIHEAFSNGAGRRPFGTRPFDRWLARIAWLPRPMMLSLRTTFHRRGRLILTVATLAAGGAAFIAALNVSAAWTRTLDADAHSRRFDVQAGFSRPYRIADVAQALSTVPDVAHAEYWAESGAMLGDWRVTLVGPDANSKLLALPLLEGRWLRQDDDGVCVVNQAIDSRGVLDLRVNGKDVRWRIVGVAKELAPGRTIYAPRRSILAATGQSGDLTRSVRIVTKQHDIPTQIAALKAVERALDRAGITVGGIHALSDSRKAFADHLVIIKSALIFAALLVVLVGGLGLMTTLSLNVVERTREIGILTAIGATPRIISRSVLFDGMVMAVLSWCLALLAAIPITFALDAASGQMFVRSPLDFYMSPIAAAAWLGLVLILAALSSFYPARRAARLAIREALAYE
ncbi:MAG: putative transport system permease protein [Thermoanaerobaculia bacterium]|nr:putative transport system permease protein [Thermoanaerobaculia bacterium]